MTRPTMLREAPFFRQPPTDRDSWRVRGELRIWAKAWGLRTKCRGNAAARLVERRATKRTIRLEEVKAASHCPIFDCQIRQCLEIQVRGEESELMLPRQRREHDIDLRQDPPLAA